MAKFFTGKGLGISKSVTFDDVLLRPQYSELRSRDDADISVEIVPGVKLRVPLMPANMQAVCSVELAVAVSIAGGLATIDQFRSVEMACDMVSKVNKQGGRVAGAVSPSRNYLDRIKGLRNAGVACIVVDSPHAFHVLTKEAVKNIRKKYKTLPLIVGNVATAEGAEMLFRLGVDSVKVGIGPGAACLTRINAGSGVPQITAIMECFKVARKFKKTILADGGVKSPGDFAKAVAAGGTAVYSGSIFAGTLEAPGKVVKKDGALYKEYWGSSSEEAKLKRTKADKSFKENLSRYVEGGKGLVQYQGTVGSVYERYAMGLRSALSYSGAKDIIQFQSKAEFLKLSPSSIYENGTHGLVGHS